MGVRGGSSMVPCSSPALPTSWVASGIWTNAMDEYFLVVTNADHSFRKECSVSIVSKSLIVAKTPNSTPEVLIHSWVSMRYWETDAALLCASQLRRIIGL